VGPGAGPDVLWEDPNVYETSVIALRTWGIIYTC